MRVVEYAQEHAAALAGALAASPLGAPLLRSDAFLNHYFLSHPKSKLLLLFDGSEEIVATLGTTTIRLAIGKRSQDASILSNTYSMKAGAFPFLLLHWMKASQIGITFPGNALMRSMVERQKRWISISGLYTYWLNWDYPAQADDPLWKRSLKPLARRVTRINPDRFAGKIRKSAGRNLAVAEEQRFDEGLARRGGEFGLRIDADAAYLNWRFCTTLDHVKYRVFRILDGRTTRGYVVLAEWPHRLIVSHCDGEDAHVLALGIMAAISEVNRGAHRYRKVLLTSMHASMVPVFHEFGFRPKKSATPFYIAGFGEQPVPNKGGLDWLVNMDFSDAGMGMGMVYKS